MAKKKLESSTKALLNRYVSEVLIRDWVRDGHEQQELAEVSGVPASAISRANKHATGLDLDSLEKLAIGIGSTFLDLLLEAIAWQDSPERSRVARIRLMRPNRARAEAAFERLGNTPEKVRVWAEAVYAGLLPYEDPDPEAVIQRMIWEKQRDPEAIGSPRLKCPNEWVGWSKVRDALLLRGEHHPYWGALIGFGETPTAHARPECFDVASLLTLVRDFAAAHPQTDERWIGAYNEWWREARKIERRLHMRRKAPRNPLLPEESTDQSCDQSTKEKIQMPTLPPPSSAPPPPRKTRD